jgi:heme exporter protein A
VGHLNALQESMTVQDNLAFAAALAGGVGCAGKVPGVLAQFGVPGLGRRVVRQLSQGQKKRVALARLALSPARLWVLDEPFVGMDDGGVRMLCDLLATHLAHQGVVVLTSHQAVVVGDVPPLVLEVGK